MAAPKPKPLPDLLTIVRLHSLDLEAGNRTAGAIKFAELVADRFCEFAATQGVKAPILLTALTADHARKFLLWLKRDHQSVNTFSGKVRPKGPRTIQAHAAELKSLTKFCVREGILEHDPLTSFRLPKIDKKIIPTFTSDHLRRLLRAIDEREQATRNRAILYFLLATGVREAELVTLKRADLDLREKRAKIRGKGEKWRYVSFDATTAKMLIRYLAERGDGLPVEVFIGREGDRMTPNAVYRLFERLAKAAAIGDEVRCSPHTCRHTFAVNFLRAHPGALLHLQEQLGHANLEMVRRYARLAETDGPPPGPGPIELLGLDHPERRRRR